MTFNNLSSIMTEQPTAQFRRNTSRARMQKPMLSTFASRTKRKRSTSSAGRGRVHHAAE